MNDEKSQCLAQLDANKFQYLQNVTTIATLEASWNTVRKMAYIHAAAFVGFFGAALYQYNHMDVDSPYLSLFWLIFLGGLGCYNGIKSSNMAEAHKQMTPHVYAAKEAFESFKMAYEREQADLEQRVRELTKESH